jgi:predicted site-specific integrase-resolvase
MVDNIISSMMDLCNSQNFQIKIATPPAKIEIIKIGYARVSTDNQNLERQIDLLNKYGIDEIFTEKISGTLASRPEIDKLLLRVREGDTAR